MLKQALVLFFIFTVITGVIYPLAITFIAQTFFPYQANGSLILDKSNNQVIGSALIGQNFSQDKYFWGRLSSTANFPYNAAASSGSNLGPTNPALLDSIKKHAASLRSYSLKKEQPIPIDLVTSSASGLDPHISLAAAEYQIERITKTRGIDKNKVQDIIRLNTIERQFGFLGEPCVNVLNMNLALDNIR